MSRIIKLKKIYHFIISMLMSILTFWAPIVIKWQRTLSNIARFVNLNELILMWCNNIECCKIFFRLYLFKYIILFLFSKSLGNWTYISESLLQFKNKNRPEPNVIPKHPRGNFSPITWYTFTFTFTVTK